MQARAFHGRCFIYSRFKPISRGFDVIPRSNCIAYRAVHSSSRRPTLRASNEPNTVLYARGAKTKSKTKLKDLPQGALKLEPYSDGGTDDAPPRYPTVVQGHRNNMEKFKNCVILTRVGGFYEVSCNMTTSHIFV